MSDITKKFQKIMSDIEQNISNNKEREYINKKIAEISVLYMDTIQNMVNIMKSKIDNIEKSQALIETKINKIESSVTGIENDIYDDGFDFQIICPYCNTEFTADVEAKTDIRCPECQNVIELDWNADEFSGCCTGHCSSCASKCGESFLDEYEGELREDEDKDDDEDM